MPLLATGRVCHGSRSRASASIGAWPRRPSCKSETVPTRSFGSTRCRPRTTSRACRTRLRVLLENVLRNGDEADVEAVARWDAKAEPSNEISFAPSRVLLQDLTGVPAVVDLAAMRDAMADLGGDPAKINPLIPAELVIDHSVQVDAFASRTAFGRNVELEFERNHERYLFLRWGQESFSGLQGRAAGNGHLPPGQPRVPRTRRRGPRRRRVPGHARRDRLAHDDGQRARCPRLGRRRIEAEAAMLGQPLSMLVPQVVGFKLSGALPEGATATDLVLTVTEILRKTGVVGKFVEYFGEGRPVPAARRPGDAREHVARVRRDVRLLPGRPGHARLPRADRAQPGAHRARRGVLQGEPALARPVGAGDLLAGRRARSRRHRAFARRPAPAAGPRAARLGEAVVPRDARLVRRRLPQRLARPRRRRHVPRLRPDDRTAAGRRAAARRGARGHVAAHRATTAFRCRAPTTSSTTARS